MPDPLPSPVGPHYLPPAPDTVNPAIRQAIDGEHLRIMEIVYYVAGGVTALFSCFFLIHFFMFLFFGLNPQLFKNGHVTTGNQPAPPPPGLFLGFAAAIGIVILLGWTFGALQVYAGRCLKKRKNVTLILCVAAVECIFIPWGTAIGICSIMVLNRPSVKALFS